MNIEVTCLPDLTQILDVSNKNSLGYLMVYLYDRWEEEKNEEPFEPYQTYLKNVMRKYTPKRTKFVCFNKEPFSLTIHLQGLNQQCEIIVDNRNLTYKLI